MTLAERASFHWPAVEQYPPYLTPKGDQSFEWRDICERCEMIIQMPPDGQASSHLCLDMPVPWKELADRHIVSRGADAVIRHSILRQPMPYQVEIISQFHEETTIDSPNRMGPFLPYDPPPPLLLSDLLMWSRSQFAHLYQVGPQTMSRLQRWIEYEQGYTWIDKGDGRLSAQYPRKYEASYYDEMLSNEE